ncbi:hypothetical protein RR46_00885 [Papilio xuthus]|uniref:Uncharacterized protein n=1 Tax=Papilio xuthus TaxID=66420 RepID=A0A0N1IB96_PAPXU|nr:hypothetical protein RR46_00885 [Papilio xuthus]
MLRLNSCRLTPLPVPPAGPAATRSGGGFRNYPLVRENKSEPTYLIYAETQLFNWCRLTPLPVPPAGPAATRSGGGFRNYPLVRENKSEPTYLILV